MSPRTSFVACLLSLASIVSCGSDDKKSATTDAVGDTTGDTTTAAADVLSTDTMVPAIEALLALGATSDASAPDLDACPLGDFDALIAKAPAVLLASASVDGALEAYVYQPGGDDGPPHLQCGRGDLGAYTGLAPAADYKDELAVVLPDFILSFDADTAHRGGTIVRFCADPIGVGFVAFCEADWYNDNVWIGVFQYDATDAAALSEEWLIDVLDDIVTDVPRIAPTVTLVAS